MKSGCGQDGHPIGTPLAGGPGCTPEVCPLLLWAGDSEMTPLEPRGGAGGGKAPASTPNAAGDTEPGVGGGGGADRGAIILWIAFFSV